MTMILTGITFVQHDTPVAEFSVLYTDAYNQNRSRQKHGEAGLQDLRAVAAKQFPHG